MSRQCSLWPYVPAPSLDRRFKFFDSAESYLVFLCGRTTVQLAPRSPRPGHANALQSAKPINSAKVRLVMQRGAVQMDLLMRLLGLQLGVCPGRVRLFGDDKPGTRSMTAAQATQEGQSGFGR